METVAVLLNVGTDQAEAFESGFAENEFPVWEDLHGRGTLVAATLSRLDISSRKVEGAAQYLVVASLPPVRGTTNTTRIPGSKRGQARRRLSIASPMAFGGETVVKIGL